MPLIADRQIPGGQCSANFTRAHGIDQHAVPADEIENRQIRASLLRVANDVEAAQIVNSLRDCRRVVNVNGRAELCGKLVDRKTGNLRANERKSGRAVHRLKLWRLAE